jgi:hypothetical protein
MEEFRVFCGTPSSLRFKQNTTNAGFFKGRRVK